jgi:hypothetical protein
MSDDNDIVKHMVFVYAATTGNYETAVQHLPTKQQINKIVDDTLWGFFSTYRLGEIVPFLTFIHKHYDNIEYNIKPNWLPQFSKFSSITAMLKDAPLEIDNFTKIMIPIIISNIIVGRPQCVVCKICGRNVFQYIEAIRNIFIEKTNCLELFKLTVIDTGDCFCWSYNSPRYMMYYKAMVFHRYDIVTYLRSIIPKKLHIQFKLNDVIRMNESTTIEDVQFLLTELNTVVGHEDIEESSYRHRNITGFLLKKLEYEYVFA